MSEDKHFNCAERVFTNVNKKQSLPNFNENCLKIASGFGGGVCGKRSICGAISGGVMFLGLKFGTDGTEPITIFNEKRNRLRKVALEFIKEFENRFGSIECRSLLGYDGLTEEEIKQLRQQKEHKEQNRRKCRGFIDFSSGFLPQLLEQVAITSEE